MFVESEMHYYRTYVKILNHSDQKENIGYIIHCKNCGHRKISNYQEHECELCELKTSIAGPLWVGKIFDKEYVKNMINEVPNLEISKSCEKTLYKCLDESEMPGIYFTLDEIGKRIKASPPKLEKMISNLKENGFTSSVTSFNPTGFRTNANINQIIKIFETSQ